MQVNGEMMKLDSRCRSRESPMDETFEGMQGLQVREAPCHHPACASHYQDLSEVLDYGAMFRRIVEFRQLSDTAHRLIEDDRTNQQLGQVVRAGRELLTELLGTMLQIESATRQRADQAAEVKVRDFHTQINMISARLKSSLDRITTDESAAKRRSKQSQTAAQDGPDSILGLLRRSGWLVAPVTLTAAVGFAVYKVFS